MYVYFARSIRGQHLPCASAFYQDIVGAIEELGHELTMKTTALKRLPSETQDTYIHRRDLDWINKSDAMVAEVSSPSLGVGYEIAYATHVADIPVLCVAVKDTNVSAMIMGGFWSVQWYRDISDLRGLLEGFLNSELMKNKSL